MKLTAFLIRYYFENKSTLKEIRNLYLPGDCLTIRYFNNFCTCDGSAGPDRANENTVEGLKIFGRGLEQRKEMLAEGNGENT